jgi:hypothetical protein
LIKEHGKIQSYSRRILFIFGGTALTSMLLAASSLAMPVHTPFAQEGAAPTEQQSPAATSTNNTSSNTTAPSSNNPDMQFDQLMQFNRPEDIATVAYVWGYPLVDMERSSNYFTSPNSPPGPGHGPWNGIHFARKLVTANFTDVVRPNADTIYGFAWLNLRNESVVLEVPPIPDRYYTFEFLDAYTNVFEYVGSRTNVTNGATYLISGPDWTGQVPSGMAQIKAPTNLVWIWNRIFVDGPSDVPNVHAIQNKVIVMPLSAFEGKTAAPSQPQAGASSKQVPLSPEPALIPRSGIEVYDEISKTMIDNAPNPPDPELIAKFETLGIGPGKTPSSTTNATIRQALETGITEGEKLIDAKVLAFGTNKNGWLLNLNLGDYKTEYLLRAAATKVGLGANRAEEALYPSAITDTEGRPLNGANNYTIHFEEAPPVKAFWSVTMYNNQSYLVDNPINRYSVGTATEGLKKNADDGSFDIYVQYENPGTDKESNWLPADKGEFSLTLRLYVPEEQILNGTWTYPTIQLAE